MDRCAVFLQRSPPPRHTHPACQPIKTLLLDLNYRECYVIVLIRVSCWLTPNEPQLICRDTHICCMRSPPPLLFITMQEVVKAKSQSAWRVYWTCFDRPASIRERQTGERASGRAGDRWEHVCVWCVCVCCQREDRQLKVLPQIRGQLKRRTSSGSFGVLAYCLECGCSLPDAHLECLSSLIWEKARVFSYRWSQGGLPLAPDFLFFFYFSERMEAICSSLFGPTAHKVQSNFIYAPAEKSAVLTVAMLLARNVYHVSGTMAVPQKCRLTQTGKFMTVCVNLDTREPIKGALCRFRRNSNSELLFLSITEQTACNNSMKSCCLLRSVCLIIYFFR